jgi:hypothetical protein
MTPQPGQSRRFCIPWRRPVTVNFADPSGHIARALGVDPVPDGELTVTLRASRADRARENAIALHLQWHNDLASGM